MPNRSSPKYEKRSGDARPRHVGVNAFSACLYRFPRVLNLIKAFLTNTGATYNNERSAIYTCEIRRQQMGDFNKNKRL